MTRSELLQLDELGDQLDRCLANDPEFDVESFLSNVSHPDMVAFLQSEAERLRRTVDDSSIYSSSNQEETSPVGVQEFRPGMVIDGFELTQLVGQGASAVVWRARNLKLGRAVALKFPKEISQSVARRLQRESQAVARLQHPNIATIHEIRNYGPRTYLVGEFVDGQPLQEILATERFSQNEKLYMLLEVVEAIAYSHSMQVIHRDLKPQNILVRDGRVPVVVDFGLARVLQSELEVLTCEGDFVGTPAYMSPEQANGTSDIDERVDIYALGVLMFQMLCGRLPFEGNIQSLIHQIVQSPTPIPSSINSKVDRDLDTICLKCMEKDPSKRFPSAQQLALEIRRYLNGEPIQSRPVSIVEKATRWIKQKPAEATLAVLLLLSMVALAIGATTYAVAMKTMRDNEFELRVSAEQAEAEANKLKGEVEQALAESNRQKAIAKTEAREKQGSMNLLKSVFQESEPVMWVLKGDGISSGEPPTLKQLFENAAGRLQRDYAGNPKIKAELLETLADSCRSTGYLDLAGRLLKEAKVLRREVLADHSGEPDAVRGAEEDLVRNQLLFAQLEHDCGRYDQAIELYERCLKRSRELPSLRMLELEAEACFHLGRLLLTQRRRNAEAKVHFENAVRCFETLSKEDGFLANASRIGVEFCDLKPGEVPASGPIADFFQKDTWARRVVQSLTHILIGRARSDWQYTSKHYRELLTALRERLPEDNPWHLLALGDYAHVQTQVGYYEEAMRAIKIAIRHGERIAPQHPHLVDAKITLGKELCRGGLYDEAIRFLEAGANDYRALHASKNKVHVDLWFEISWCFLELGAPAKAEPYCEELVPYSKRWSAVEIAWLRFLESRICRDTDSENAAALLEKAHSMAQRLKTPPNNGIWCHRMATICVAAQDPASAIKYAQAGVDVDRERFFADHPRVANRLMLLGQAYQLDGQGEQARQQFTLALESRTKYLSDDSPLVSESRRALDALK